MKKWIGIILCIGLTLAFVGCGDNGLEFDSQSQMVSYLKGIWEHEGNYYIISEDKIMSTDNGDIADIMEDYFVTAIMDDDNLEGLKAEETFGYVQKNLEDNVDDITTYDIKRGRIVINGEESIFITNEGLKGKFDWLYSKISEVPAINKDVFEELFEKTKSNIPLEKTILTTEKISQKIKQFHPEINSLTLASDSGIYTDSGDCTDWTTCFISTGTDVRFMKGRIQNTFTYTCTEMTSGYVTVVMDVTRSKPLIDDLKEALLFVSKYPKALTAEQLLNKFESEYRTEYGAKELKVKRDGISYRIIVPNDSTKGITIRIATGE